LAFFQRFRSCDDFSFFSVNFYYVVNLGKNQTSQDFNI